MADTLGGIAANEIEPTWREHRGERLSLFAPEGSYAMRRAEDELRAAERVSEALVDLLGPAAERDQSSPVTIYLTDPVGERGLGAALDPEGGAGGPPGGEHEAIVRVTEPEAPGEPIAWPLTRLLVPRWFGPNAAAATVVVDGIAGVIAARTETGPTVEEADEWVRGELEAGRPVSVFARTVTPDGMPADRAVDDRVATSFVASLVKASGEEPLRRFLAAYDPARRDRAALSAYQRPLGRLEEAWLGGLRRDTVGSAPFRALIRHMRPLLRPYLWTWLESVGYMLLGALLGLVLPLASKYLVDDVLPGGSLRRLGLFVLVLLAVYVLDALVGVRRNYVAGLLNQSILMDLQERMFSHLQRLPHRFYANAKVGDLMSRLSTDLQAVQMAIATFIGTGIYLAFSAIVAAVTLLALSTLLGVLVLVVVPLFAVSYLALRTRFQVASYEYQRLTGEVASASQENLSSHAVIKAFGLADRAVASYHARLLGLRGAFMRLVVIGSLFEASMTLATTLGQLVVLGVGGYLVMEDRLTLGTLLAFIGLLPSLFQPIAALSGVAQTVQKASGALDRVTELIDAPATIADKPDAPVLPPLSEEIRLEGVSFGYEPGQPILRDLDLTIPAGANVAFVGPSGCGKSTVINLLMRFFDPDLGRVLFDEHDLRDITIASLRGQIGLVFQDTFVFDSTVRDNIAIGRPDATDAEVIAAASAAQLDSYIAALPAGYDTVLGERGVRMSGGQRQRLAIARALLRDPRILILDEATSALDARTEAEIQEVLAAAARGRTTISITHRLASVTASDRIYVLEQGRLAEEGPFDRLVRAGGLFQRLYDEQMGHLTGGVARVEVEAARLRSVPLFAALAEDALSAVANRLTLERYAPGDEIVRQGDPGAKLYVLVEGQAEVVVAEGDRERRVNILNPGDYFGEMALLNGATRVATVRATVPTELYALAKGDFNTLLEREPAVREAVTRTVAARRAALGAVAPAASPAGLPSPRPTSESV